MDHLKVLFEFLTGAGVFSVGVIAGLLVPVLTVATMRRWWDRTQPLTRAATIVAALPALAFTILLFLAPPAGGGWNFAIGFILFAMFSLPTWLVLLSVVWLVLVIKRRLCLRLFGTFCDVDEFAPQCGFPNKNGCIRSAVPPGDS